MIAVSVKIPEPPKFAGLIIFDRYLANLLIEWSDDAQHVNFWLPSTDLCQKCREIPISPQFLHLNGQAFSGTLPTPGRYNLGKILDRSILIKSANLAFYLAIWQVFEGWRNNWLDSCPLSLPISNNNIIQCFAPQNTCHAVNQFLYFFRQSGSRKARNNSIDLRQVNSDYPISIVTSLVFLREIPGRSEFYNFRRFKFTVSRCRPVAQFTFYSGQFIILSIL